MKENSIIDGIGVFKEDKKGRKYTQTNKTYYILEYTR